MRGNSRGAGSSFKFKFFITYFEFKGVEVLGGWGLSVVYILIPITINARAQVN